MLSHSVSTHQGPFCLHTGRSFKQSWIRSRPYASLHLSQSPQSSVHRLSSHPRKTATAYGYASTSLAWITTSGSKDTNHLLQLRQLLTKPQIWQRSSQHSMPWRITINALWLRRTKIWLHLSHHWDDIKFLEAPYGMSSISEHYKRWMDEAFTGLSGYCRIVDDVVIYDVKPAHHADHVRQFLQHCTV